MTTRRELLKAAAVGSALLALPSVAAPSPKPLVLRPIWLLGTWESRPPQDLRFAWFTHARIQDLKPGDMFRMFDPRPGFENADVIDQGLVVHGHPLGSSLVGHDEVRYVNNDVWLCYTTPECDSYGLWFVHCEGFKLQNNVRYERKTYVDSDGVMKARYT